MSGGDPGAQETGPQVGVLVYPGVSELELGLMLGLLPAAPGTAGTPGAAALTLARSRGSVMCVGGLVCTPQLIFAAAPPLAGILVPGGLGAQKAGRDVALRAFLGQARSAGLPVGVCGSGLLLAGEAGLLGGRLLGCPAALVDSVWGYLPADIQPDVLVEDAAGPALYSGPGGLAAAGVVLALSARLWGAERAGAAARGAGFGWREGTHLS